MPRAIKDVKLDTASARLRLPRSGKPYYRDLDEGLHLGYRRAKRSGKWVMRYYVGKQAYKVETIGLADDYDDADGHAVLSFRQAQQAARRMRAERQAQAAGVPLRTGPYTVADAVADYLEHLEAQGKSAADSRTRAQALIVPELGHHDTAKLTPTVIRRWQQRLAKSPARLRTRPGEKQRYRDDDGGPEAERRRKATANRVLTVLKAALNHAWREGKIASDDAWRRVRPFPGVDAARVRYLDTSECTRLINASPPDFRELVRGALYTGMRYGELAALNVDDFNDDAGSVHVRTSKTGKGRHVYLNPEGLEFFKRMTAGRDGSEPMFRKASGERWAKSHQRRPLIEACARAGIDPPADFHCLRHTYASHAVMAGAELIVVAQNVGHADTRMVEKHYGHLAESYVARRIGETAPSFGLEEINVAPLKPR